MALPLEDYAVIGDRHTVALVGRDGSIDWLCLPRFDSGACFAHLLGDEHGSRWLLAPVDPGVTVSRAYVPDTLALVTTYSSPDGEVRVTDVMPMNDGRHDVVRRVEGVRGRLHMRHLWVVRFEYGLIRPWVYRTRDEGPESIVAVAGPNKVVLSGDRLPVARDGRHEDEFDVAAGDRVDLSMTWVPSHETPVAIDLDRSIAETLEEQRAWASAIEYDGPWRDQVVRSLVTLRSLTHEHTGGIVAAATTSLPEEFGGERNWDYRFSWLRDASLTVEAMVGTDRPEIAQLWLEWLLRAIAGDPEDLQIMYTVDGGRWLPERTLDHLAGYEDSRPVRVGNAAFTQRQTDVVGAVLSALDAARRAGLRETPVSWAMQKSLGRQLMESWREPDNGIWEIRGPRQHFTHSKVMVWVAFDRLVRGVEDFDLDGPVEQWRTVRDQVRAEILERGYDATRNTFTQHFDTTEVDASLLLIPLVGFLPGEDPRVQGTIRAVEQDLLHDGQLMRYRTETGVDGIAGGEATFLACTFWLVSAYVLAGRVAEARELMDRTVRLANDVGLLAEEYDTRRGRLAGNFPQAYSHLTLVQAARLLRLATPD